MNRKTLSKICSWLLTIASVFLFCVLGLRIVFFGIEVRGSSMDKTLYSSQLLIVRRTHKVQRGDIVIVHPSHGLEEMFSGDYIVKRVIATEGDSLYVKNHVVYLKTADSETFEQLDEPYVSSYTPDFETVVLEENQIFCMGDNRAISKDSTEVGPFLKNDVKGVVLSSFLDESFLKSVLLFLL